MADVKISALPAATTPLAGTELVPIVQSGVTSRVSVDNLTAGKTVAASTVNVDANTASAAVRITQTGSGNALLVEDSANPDATPFVVSNDGRVVVGHTAPLVTAPGSASSPLQVQANISSADFASVGVVNWVAGVQGTGVTLSKSRSGVIGTRGIVSDGDAIGRVQFNADDGVGFIPAARIEALVDGTPGTNDMPGRLVFSTTADGASFPTERMRINAAGNVGIGTSVQTARFEVVGGTLTTSNPATYAVGVANTGGANRDLALGSDGTYAYVQSFAGKPLYFNSVGNNVLFGSGNVGIGTASTLAPLTIASASADPILALNATGTQANAITFYRSGSATSALFQNNGGAVNIFNVLAQPIIFSTNTLERMRIDAAGNVGIGTASPGATLNVVANSSSDALRITQTGTGNVLVVEDSANPDSNPFVIDQIGRVIVGNTTAFAASTLTPGINFQGIGGTGNPNTVGISAFSADANGPVIYFGKSRGATVGSTGLVADGDFLGALFFEGSDGTAQRRGASIVANVDGTPGASDMPGRLVFSTTADGASSPTERMRIDASGNVGIGTSSPAARLDLGSIVHGTPASGITASFWNSSGNGFGIGVSSNQLNYIAGTTSSNSHVWYSNGTERMRITATGNVVAGASVALATTATDGFLYVPTCAGVPTGTPTAITGMAPIVVNTTNNKLYFYSGGAWRDAGP